MRLVSDRGACGLCTPGFKQAAAPAGVRRRRGCVSFAVAHHYGSQPDYGTGVPKDPHGCAMLYEPGTPHMSWNARRQPLGLVRSSQLKQKTDGGKQRVFEMPGFVGDAPSSEPSGPHAQHVLLLAGATTRTRLPSNSSADHVSGARAVCARVRGRWGSQRRKEKQLTFTCARSLSDANLV